LFTDKIVRGTSLKFNVTLVNPPYPKGVQKRIFMPLGIGYLAAVLEEKGYDVNVIDYQMLDPTLSDLKDEFARLQPGIVGVTSATATYKPALEIVKAAKEACPGCLTVMGGPHVTVMDEQTFRDQPETDIVVRGEGEQTLLELASLKSVSNLKGLDLVAGITFRRNGQIIRTIDRPFIQNLDALPLPAYKFFPLDKYRIFGKLYLPIITSRGCPFQCTFCLAAKMCGRVLRMRSPKKVIDELEWLRDTYGAEAFSFYDDTFTGDVNRAEEICSEIKRRSFNCMWDCRTRVDRVSPEILAKMRSANCRLIHFGVESGNQEMLNAMKKGTTLEQNSQAIKWAKEAGISVAISIIFGYPGETLEMVKQTLDFIRKTEPDYVYICEAVPYPGTELYQILKNSDIKMSTDWNQYHEQTQVFNNPMLSLKKMEEIKREFYDNFFSPAYYFRKKVKKDFYSQTMAKTALNHLVSRAYIRLRSRK
jgi:radical SAM superfamily enzyme YgiQ (UPF0313 family)